MFLKDIEQIQIFFLIPGYLSDITLITSGTLVKENENL